MKCGFFCGGIGGAAIAAQNLGHEITWMIDNDPRVCQIWKNNLPGKVINQDVCFVDPNQLEKVDYIHFSPSSLYFNPSRNLHYQDSNPIPGIEEQFIKFLEVIKPNLITLECSNLYAKSAQIKQIIEAILPNYYYHHQSFDYQKYGLPQKKRRHLLIASKNNLDSLLVWIKEKQTPVYWDKFIDNIPLGKPIKIPKKLLKYIKKQRYYPDRNVILYRKTPASAEEGQFAPNIYPSTGNRGSTFQPKPRKNSTGIFLWQEQKWYRIPHRFFLRIQSFPDWYELKEDNLYFFKYLGNSTPPIIIQQILQNV